MDLTALMQEREWRRCKGPEWIFMLLRFLEEHSIPLKFQQ